MSEREPEVISSRIAWINFCHVVIHKQTIKTTKCTFIFKIGFVKAQSLHWPFSVLFWPPMKLKIRLFSKCLISPDYEWKGWSLSESLSTSSKSSSKSESGLTTEHSKWSKHRKQGTCRSYRADLILHFCTANDEICESKRRHLLSLSQNSISTNS